MGFIQSTGSKRLLRFRPRYCVEAALTLDARLLDHVWISMCLDQAQRRSVGKTHGIEAWFFLFGSNAAEGQLHSAGCTGFPVQGAPTMPLNDWKS